jgi:putative ATPase
VRDRVMVGGSIQRHALVLDLNAGTGLLTWEALRRAPEGGAWALAGTAAEAASLREIAARLPELERPTVLQGRLDELADLLAMRGEADLRFDTVLGRNALAAYLRTARLPSAGISPALALAPARLQPGGTLSLAEVVPYYTQRLYALVDPSSLASDLASRLRDAEEAIYGAADDALVNWAENDLQSACAGAGLEGVQVALEESQGETQVTSTLLARWFNPAPPGERPSYAQRLAALLSPNEIVSVRGLYERQLLGRAVPWRTVTAYVVAHAPSRGASR